ncbi:MAG TPA: CBS domain-containing protein [Dehalococcoidia bacterium]|nr:CBS domain-containing protein [Dehalococcoidia bacterium]
MKSGFTLGKIFGIPLRLHYTWFLIFVLITFSLVAYLPLPEVYPLWQRIAFGLAASLLFFTSIITHELAHSFIAVRNSIPVKSITLFVFGGVSQITKEATRPNTELLMAIVGPLSSLVIAGIFYVVYLLLTEAGELLAAGMAQWLAFINVLLAAFNLIPGFPLDGGRVFRSIVWLSTGNYRRATRISTIVGRVIGYLFIAGGIVVMFVTHEWISGLWLAFIGWFLENAATTSYRQALLRDALYGFTARDVMNTDCPVISHKVSLDQLVQDYILHTGRHCFIVVEEGKLEGIVTLHDIKTVSQERWSTTSVKEIMVPTDKLKIACPDQDALSVFEQMDEGNVNQMPVIEEGKVIGMVARDGLIHFLRIRGDLGI